MALMRSRFAPCTRAPSAPLFAARAHRRAKARRLFGGEMDRPADERLQLSTSRRTTWLLPPLPLPPANHAARLVRSRGASRRLRRLLRNP